MRATFGKKLMFEKKSTASLLSEDLLTPQLSGVMDYYDRVDDIVKRTHIAMGRTVKYNTGVSSTVHSSLKPSLNASTR